MVQWGKVPVAKAKDLSSSPMTHMVEGVIKLLKIAV